MTITNERYRISELAQRTGFSAPTLRYYEDIGLLPPAERTPAGYRLYDDRTVERLTFIARAKQLGCTLDEIADLATAWERNECGPIKHRLRALVAAKLEATEARIAELVELADDLRSTAATLASVPLEGPCDDSCGCVGRPNDTVPITCTITAAEIPGRIEAVERMRTGLQRIERTPSGLLLHFPDTPTMRSELATFAVDEKRCCQFWSFEVIDEREGVALRWDGPPAADDLLRLLESFFTSDAPLTILDGLL